jgi:hypothetical protein
MRIRLILQQPSLVLDIKPSLKDQEPRKKNYHVMFSRRMPQSTK